jgi:nitroreductase
MNSLSQMFHLPEHLVPVSLIALGYPEEEKPVPERFEPELIHHNIYGTPLL